MKLEIKMGGGVWLAFNLPGSSQDILKLTKYRLQNYLYDQDYIRYCSKYF
jgi:hypothetical protein